MKIFTASDVSVPAARKYAYVGTCRVPTGEVKVRFGNDVQQRLKVLGQNGFQEAKYVELDEPLDRVSAVQAIIGLPEFAGQEEQAALQAFLAKHGAGTQTAITAEEAPAEETEITTAEEVAEEVTE